MEHFKFNSQSRKPRESIGESVAELRKLLPNLPTFLWSLYTLLKKRIKWPWRTLQVQDFENLKQLLQTADVLVHYPPDKTLILICNSWGVSGSSDGGWV